MPSTERHLKATTLESSNHSSSIRKYNPKSVKTSTDGEAEPMLKAPSSPTEKSGQQRIKAGDQRNVKATNPRTVQNNSPMLRTKEDAPKQRVEGDWMCMECGAWNSQTTPDFCPVCGNSEF
ncbi:hypothetical protein P154DRAFT_523000 [Amniculicola lignicola CBS 123094]|uniref:RanBP2-type domain-containing protein n=1 Tax=Amniculicola lignicola CBS 123094 TaxID=1392246 RepID=A0A6A5WDI8_9PLEO|nr:hypothetical protein P154DRAFT_523000 [Amniculicola lignicola CBS 123094]